MPVKKEHVEAEDAYYFNKRMGMKLPEFLSRRRFDPPVLLVDGLGRAGRAGETKSSCQRVGIP